MKMTQVLTDDTGASVLTLEYDPGVIPSSVVGALGILTSSLCSAARTERGQQLGLDAWADVPPATLAALHEASPGTHEVLSIELNRGVPAEPDPPPKVGQRAAYGEGEREPCPLGCGKQLRPGNGLSNHVNNKCPKRNLDVDVAGPEPQPPAKPTRATESADGERIECPFGCGKKALAGRAMESHKDRCRLRVP